VLPLLFFDNRWIRAAGTGIDLKLPSAGPLSFALRATYSFDGYKPGDAPVLAGMAERKASFWLGATTTWHDPLADVSFELLGDASGHSKGQRAKLAIDHGFVFGSVELRPRVAVDWMDAKYVDYYYGVRAEEATAGRPEYRGKATFDPELGVRARYAFAPHQAAFLDVNSTRLGNEIANSPLVGRRTPTGVSLGYLYRF
jgi:outer membrane scaffolding protein for murein synthesis (MipA/OmpV family)